MHEPLQADSRPCCSCRFYDQYVAQMGKVFILRRRRYCSTFFEMLLPVGAFLVLWAIWDLLGEQTAGDTYLSQRTISNQRWPLQTGVYDLYNTARYLSWCENKGYRLFLTANSDGLFDKVQDLKNTLIEQSYPNVQAETIQIMSSESALEDYATDRNYANNPHICGAVVLKEIGGSSGVSFEYSIRMNASISREESYPQQVPDTRFITDELGLTEWSNAVTYAQHGFSALQNSIDAWIINQTLAGSPNAQDFYPVAWPVQPFPVPRYNDDLFVAIVGGILGLFLTLCYIWPLQRIVKSLVEEKETRIKELMFQMSLSPLAWFLSWFTLYAIFFAISVLIIVLITASNIYQNSDGGIIFVLYFLFSLAVFAFGFMASSIFSKANTAATMTTVLFLGSFFGYYGISSDTSEGARALACISAPVCIGQAGVVASTLESNGLGVTNETIGVAVNKISISTCILMLVVDIILYILIGLYLEQVWPNEYGVPKDPWFIINPFYWCPRAYNRAKPEDRKFPDVYEPDPKKPLPSTLKNGLSIINLQKEFSSSTGTFTAVDGLSVDMFRDQVFSLLGHNGAGKTTTINMLTGMYAMTSGDAIVETSEGEKLSVSRDLARLQQKIGVCPQHDVLYPDLTVTEHLRIMGRTKGVPHSKLEEEVTRIVELVGLTEKVSAQTQALSGGMKRKLSISMALIGRSDLVFLDEPTSGVDPYSRRSMWEVIRRAKNGRVIILTTHFMDEADTLGDRIGIMEHGKLVCCGSSLHLKSVYGVGYTFTVSLKTKGNAEAVRKLVKDVVPSAKTRTTAGEVQCRLPLASASKFPEMMESLDKSSEAWGISSYGISVTTLEEVFLKVGAATKEILDEEEAIGDRKEEKHPLLNPSEQSIENQATAAGGNSPTPGELKANVINVKPRKEKEDDLKSLEALNNTNMGESGFLRQLYALLLKRFWNYQRDKKGWAWTILYPLVILAAGLGLMQLGINKDFPSLTLDTTMFNKPNYIPVNDIAFRYLAPAYDAQTFSLLNASSSSCPDGLPGSRYPISFEDITTPFAAENMQHVLSCTWSDQFEQSMYLAFVGYDTNRTNGTNGQYVYTGNIDQVLTGEEPYQTEYLSWDSADPAINATNGRFPFAAFFNMTAYHAPGVLINVINNAMGRNYTGNNAFNIKVVNDPLPLTDNERQLPTSIVGLVVSLGFSMIPAFFIFFIVYERNIGAKHQQIISGVDLLAYWFSTWIWDAVSALIPGLLSFFIFLGFGLDPLIGENSGAMFLNILLYSLSITPFVYIASFFFDNATSAQNIMLFVFFLTGAILAIVSSVLDQISSTADLNKHLKFLYRLFPSFCFAECVTNLMGRQKNGNNEGIWELDVTGYPMIFMAWEAVVYFAVVLGIEFFLLNPNLFAWAIPTAIAVEDQENDGIEEDEDVKAEKEKVQEMVQKNEKDMITLCGLRKVFGTIGENAKVAVRDMHFAVPRGQCFGFLGINGAGKTTTLKMLTGAIYPTSGQAFLNGLDIMNRQRQIRKYLGYCPQFDSFLGSLTARETLTMFGHIKGIDNSILPSYVDKIIRLLGLTEYADRKAGSYSGGNKRKLSVGIALMGNPPMVFLDEPSTGMDPASRRTMWNLIQKTMSKRAVILTTHSMEECEALCQRIGIMVGGRLRCLGSEQHLRHRFGNGYQIDITLEDQGDIEKNKELRADLLKWIESAFTGIEMVEDQTLNLKFHLPKKELKSSLGSAFADIEKEKKRLKITEYSLSEVSLEQIFIYFARQQREETGNVAGFKDSMKGDAQERSSSAGKKEEKAGMMEMDEKKHTFDGEPVQP